MSDALNNPNVQRVIDVLKGKDASACVIELAETARTAQDAAASLGVALGAIVKSLVFTIDGGPVMALVAGDRQCCTDALPRALGREGVKAKRADADLVRRATGFAIGGVSPVGHLEDIPIVLDASLARFDAVYAAAGHPHCVFATTFEALQGMTSAVVADDISLAPK